MNRILTKKFRNLFLIFIGIFILLFLFRLGYGYTLDAETERKDKVYFDSFSSDKKNYASDDFKDKMSYEKPDQNYDVKFDAITPVDQKYEKIAQVHAETYDFEKEEEFVRNEVEFYDGIIQYEKKYGNKGDRKLQLQIGVPPDNFDSLYTKLIKVGITHFKEIIKNDKTNDYLELNARKSSLEKTHTSLVEFKQKGGKIDEYVNLENRILEIEEELQSLGVNLGDFDKSNEFCTIKFALSEGRPAIKKTITFYHRCKVALQWSIAWFLRLMSALFFVLLIIYIIILISESGFFGKIKSAISRYKKKTD